MVYWILVKQKLLREFKIDLMTLDKCLWHLVVTRDNKIIAAKCFWVKSDAIRAFNKIKQRIQQWDKEERDYENIF